LAEPSKFASCFDGAAVLGAFGPLAPPPLSF
jgi:hypothetical protein